MIAQSPEEKTAEDITFLKEYMASFGLEKLITLVAERNTFIAQRAMNYRKQLEAQGESNTSLIAKLVNALEIADKFCGSHTADECPDTIACPIADALGLGRCVLTPGYCYPTVDMKV
jgi:hypothetical protein